MEDQIRISLYSEWMTDQVCKLFADQYQIDFTEFKEQFIKFYESDFQRPRCIRIVALDGEDVVGFQSFFYWPYKNKNVIYNSYQSGNSIVAPSHRGKGIFQRLLNFADENRMFLKIDFMVGFPVAASFNSFLKCGWNNILDLQWIVSLVNPIGITYDNNTDGLQNSIKFKRESIFETEEINILNEDISLSSTKEFRNWRDSFSKDPSFYYNFKLGNEVIEFEIKLKIRGKLHECVIGRIRAKNLSGIGLKLAIKSLKRSLISETPSVTLLTIAANPQHDFFAKIEKAMGPFSKTINRKIHFIVKHVSQVELNNPNNWLLFRSDIDTW